MKIECMCCLDIIEVPENDWNNGKIFKCPKCAHDRFNKIIELSFKEQFPSLKLASNETFYDTVNLASYAHYEEIKESCLDKQKVRDAIEKYLPDHKTLLCMGSCPICRFKKELNL